MTGWFSYEVLETVLKWSASAAMIFGGIIPYIPQYRSIQKKNDTEGFSLFVCFTLLIANILRIFFWFGSRFELPLLIQSILINITMLLMVKLCVNINSRNQIIKAKDRSFKDFDVKYFWKWTNFQSYVEFLLVFGALGGLMTYLFGDYPIFVETVGLLALMTESLLGIPQFLNNFMNKSTSGMSITMILLWIIGDTFKTYYFISREAPTQFKLCGFLQVCVDIAILLQVGVYSQVHQYSTTRKY